MAVCKANIVTVTIANASMVMVKKVMVIAIEEQPISTPCNLKLVAGP